MSCGKRRTANAERTTVSAVAFSLSPSLSSSSYSPSPTICSFSLGIFGLSSSCIVKLHSHRCWRFAPRGKLSSKRKKMSDCCFSRALNVTLPHPPPAANLHYSNFTHMSLMAMPSVCVSVCVGAVGNSSSSSFLLHFPFFYFRHSLPPLSLLLPFSISLFLMLAELCCVFLLMLTAFADLMCYRRDFHIPCKHYKLARNKIFFYKIINY